jgi:hypothetical protein
MAIAAEFISFFYEQLGDSPESPVEAASFDEDRGTMANRNSPLDSRIQI